MKSNRDPQDLNLALLYLFGYGGIRIRRELMSSCRRVAAINKESPGSFTPVLGTVLKEDWLNDPNTIAKWKWWLLLQMMGDNPYAMHAMQF